VARTPTEARRRLTRAADFDAVYRRGRSTASRHLVVYTFASTPAGNEPAASAGPRLGIAVSRKVGGAVVRNRVKRQIREAFDRVAAEARAGRDYVVVARPALAPAIEERGFDWLVGELRDLVAARGDGR
jgi:ribonuclease P protein component